MNQSHQLRRPPPPIPILILTGFLGSGKTTFLNQVIQNPALGDALVMINEFGEIGLDHLLVETIDRDMMLLSSGCLCCTIRGELIDMLEDLLRRRDNQRIKAFDRIIIETTGLADPAPILHSIIQHPYLKLRFYVESLITIADATNVDWQIVDHPEAAKQIAMADRILISKSDLATEPDAAATLNFKLQKLNPGAPISDTKESASNPAELLSATYDADGKSKNVLSWLNAGALENRTATGEPAHIHEHSHEHAHDHTHDRNRHSDTIRAVCLRSAQPVTATALDMFLEMVRQLHGASLLRVKGLVATTEAPGKPLIIHGVQHVFSPPQQLDRWPDEDHGSRLVFILRDLDPEHLRGLWNAFLNQPGIDQADAQALSANPLKINTGGLFE